MWNVDTPNSITVCKTLAYDDKSTQISLEGKVKSIKNSYYSLINNSCNIFSTFRYEAIFQMLMI